jgi:hypothetical protein
VTKDARIRKLEDRVAELERELAVASSRLSRIEGSRAYKVYRKLKTLRPGEG